MTQEVIDVGVNADDGTGDSLYESGNKINNNFGDFFDLTPVLSDLRFYGNNITTKSTNADIDVHPSGTGSILFPGIRFNDNNIEAVRTNDDLKISASGSGQVVIDGIGFNAGTTISATDSSSVNINENLIVDGTLSATGTFAFGSARTFITGSTFGTLTLANGSITDSSGAITFGNEDLTTTGTINGATGSVFGNITLANGSITDSSGSISFSNEDLTTTGTINGATGSVFGNITLANGSITDSSGAITFVNENLTTTGTMTAGTQTIGSGSITDSSGSFTFVDEDLTTTGNITVDGAATMASMAVSGATSFAAPATVDNLTFNDNIILTSSNADLILAPGGTGVVSVANMTIDSSINFTDNVIKVTTSNADLVLSANGSGSVEINNIDLNSGTIDNTIIGANEPAAGAFDPLNYDTLVLPNKITFSGNTISTNNSNDNLEFEANGSGKVIVNNISLPNADGQTGAFLQTDGSGALSFFLNSIALEVSDIQDERQTIGFATKTNIDAVTAVGGHESITEANVVIDNFSQSRYDSAWYLMLSRSVAAGSAIEYQFQKNVIAQGTDDGSTFGAFYNSFQPIRSSANDAPVDVTADIRTSSNKVRLLGRAGLLADSSISSNNSVSFFRIGLGDDDSSGTQAGSGLAQTKVVADLDSAEATLDSWAAASYRGAKYFVSINNTTTNEVSSTEVMVVHDGSDAYVTEYNTLISNNDSTPLATFTADIDSGNVRLRGANGTAGTCRVHMYRILLSDSESTNNGTYVDVIGATTIKQIDTTPVDHVTTTIVSRQGLEEEEVVDQFTAATYDSAWYFTILRDQNGGRYAFHKYSLLHGTTDDSTIEAFVTDSGVVRTEEFDVATANADIRDGNVRLLLTGVNDGSTTVDNTVASYRIGLGDDDSTGYAGEESGLASVVINTDVDSASESIDTFAHADHRGAKYFVSVMNASEGTVMNVELLVVHDGSAAYITSYNEHSSGNLGASTSDVLATFTAAIDGDDVVVSAAGLQTNLRIHMYRILLADDQSATTSTNVNVISAVTVSSSATLIDSFNTSTYAAAHYIIIGTKSNDSCIMEATVISDGTTASISEGPQVSTEETPMLNLTVNQVSATAVVQASATSGGSTTVNAYRIQLPKTAGVPYSEIDSVAQSSKQAINYITVTKQTEQISGNTKAQIDDILVVADAAAAYNVRISVNSDTASSEDVTDFDTVLVGGNIKLRATLKDGTASAVINAWKVELARAVGVPTSVATLDSWDKTIYRSVVYNVSISSADSGTNGYYETCQITATHDGTTAYLSVFGRTSSTSDDLVVFTADIDGDNFRLRGTINNNDTHEVTVVRRIIEL